MELGSEFNLDMQRLNFSETSFFEYMGNTNYRLFESGRSALRALVPALGSGYILMPEYICDSVLKCFSSELLIFYRLKNNLQIDADDLLSKINADTAVVYLMHYFGTMQSMDTCSLLQAKKEKYGFTIIEDSTHSIFSKKRTIGDYCVASLRKWFALPNGAVLYSDGNFQLPSDRIRRRSDHDKAYAMMLKTLCLEGALNCRAVYRKIFNDCEDRLDTADGIWSISDFSAFLLRCTDVYEAIRRRKSNFRFLEDKLCTMGLAPIGYFTEEDCPFAFPVLVPDRDGFRQYLMDHSIYCAIHWPFDGSAHSERPMAQTLANSILSLPIDQRYGEEEMSYLLSVIAAYKGRLIC